MPSVRAPKSSRMTRTSANYGPMLQVQLAKHLVLVSARGKIRRPELGNLSGDGSRVSS